MTKLFAATITAMACLNAVNGQTPAPAQPHSFTLLPRDNRPMSGEEWRLNLVARLISLPSPVTNGAPQLFGMGDEAAVDIVKTFGVNGPPSAAEMQSALDIIDMAFAHPDSIGTAADQQPRVALFLLQHLGLTATDPAMKSRIASKVTHFQAVVAAGAAQKR
jgi:hypothetical protein